MKTFHITIVHALGFTLVIEVTHVNQQAAEKYALSLPDVLSIHETIEIPEGLLWVGKGELS